MKKINETLSKQLAYEERLCLYRLAQKKEFSADEVFGVLQMVEDLTKVNLTSKGFDAKTVSALGIDNCCNFFKVLCQQYSDLITMGEDGEYIAHQKRMDVAIGTQIQRVAPRIIDIGLYDSAKKVDDAISENFIELMNGSMKGNEDTMVYQYAMFNTFAEMYYSIRDLIEGKTYYDGQFMTEHRELPSEYEQQSQSLLNAFMVRSKVASIDVAKSQLLTALNEGIELLKNIPLENQMEDAYARSAAKRIEELKKAYFEEHGYPENSDGKLHK